ncbi:MAG: signal recognition particle-docking protein FtsY [Deltaproteobacteria bacterium]|nr:signal recognition particle-docking protein FtsY [Deltaproteobacteria bacterium]
MEAKKERVEPVPAGKPEEPAPAPPLRRERPAEKAVETQAQLLARQAEEAAQAARLEAKRLVEEARKGKDEELAKRAEEARLTAQKAREEAEAAKARAEADERRRKDEEEERKKAEYRARKAQEVEEKERRKREAEERKRLEEEEAARKKAEEEAAKRAAQEEEKKKVAAQAGKTLAEGLAKTRGGFMASLNSLFGRNKVLDESVLGELEEVLFSADIGVKTATGLLDFARAKVRSKDLSDAEKLKAAMRQEVQRIVGISGRAPDLSSHRPFVVMVVGVNGSGKTTTIGKLAAQLTASGKKVLLAAGDTFRAAATEQLEIWGQRAGAPVVKGKEGSDPGAVIFDAIKRAQSESFDILLCDTAGRLHTKAPLMEELKRVKRVMDKAMPGTPHDVLLVLDSTNGQNAIAQAREFNAALTVQGLVLTKLDGTAKGGVVIGICDELNLPLRYVGIGEAVGDLKAFDPEGFVQALFD